MSDLLRWSHEVVLAPEAASASGARDFVCTHLVEHDLPYLVDDVRLVASELATNAVRHARTPFKVTIRSSGEAVVLSVEDDEPTAPAPRHAGVLEANGRGLSIVAGLSNDWGSAPGGQGAKSVWASFTTLDGIDTR